MRFLRNLLAVLALAAASLSLPGVAWGAECGDGICEPEEEGNCSDCNIFDPCEAYGQCYSPSCPGYDFDTCCVLDGTCPDNPSCGDGACTDGETCSSCATDCGDCDPCEAERCSGIECAGYCDESQPGGACDQVYCCQNGSISCDENCSDGEDNDYDGMADCADTTNGFDGCCADPACAGDINCYNPIYGCMDPCADNYDPLADAGCQEGGTACCTFATENFAVSGCCSDGQDNDSDGTADLDDYDCKQACQDVCATNYNAEAASGAANADYFACEFDYEKLTDGCCTDGQDNDNDGPFDEGGGTDQFGNPQGGDADCALGGFCSYQYDYGVDLTCASTVTGDNQTGFTSFLGTASTTYAEPCPSIETVEAAAQVSVTNSLVTTGDMCGLSIGDSAPAGDFIFSLTDRDACLNIAGNQETVPADMEQDAAGNCAALDCPEGDSDGDGLCEDEDPCDLCADLADCEYVADADISSNAAATAAGLDLNVDGTCDCANGGEYDPILNECIVDVCANLAGTQDEAWLTANPDFVQSGENCVCGGESQQLCTVDEPICIGDTECCQPDEYYYCPDQAQCITNGQDCGGTCRAGYTFCESLGECIEDAVYDEQCVVGCYGYEQEGAYCTVVVQADGATAAPWSTAYPDGASLASFFGGHLNQELMDQDAARNDGDPTTPYYPIYGTVTSTGQQCDGNLCQHGEECLLYVGSGGTTAATCVPVECDPCDLDAGCYDADLCVCDPEIEVCCTPGEPSCDLPRRGVAIEVLPNIIQQGESCLVLWASQGMASTTVAGEGVDVDVWHNFAGAMLVTPDTSSIYKIYGTGTDGLSYEAADLCAMNPVIREF